IPHGPHFRILPQNRQTFPSTSPDRAPIFGSGGLCRARPPTGRPGNWGDGDDAHELAAGGGGAGAGPGVYGDRRPPRPGRGARRSSAVSPLAATRKSLQQKGELRRLTNEVVLDATGTYIDLLAAHNGLAIARGLGADLRGLRDRAQRLANLEKGARIQVVQIDAEIAGQEQTVR